MGQNWSVPVHRGELQAANLGMAVACFGETEDGAGEQVFNKSGELVCLKPFPCMPTHFWNDKDGVLYKMAYFSKFPGIVKYSFAFLFVFFIFPAQIKKIAQKLPPSDPPPTSPYVPGLWSRR